MKPYHLIPGHDDDGNSVLVYNRTIRPVRVSARGHFLGGREWACVNGNDTMVIQGIEKGILRPRRQGVQSESAAAPEPEEVVEVVVEDPIPTKTPAKRGRKPKPKTEDS